MPGQPIGMSGVFITHMTIYEHGQNRNSFQLLYGTEQLLEKGCLITVERFILLVI